VNRITFISASAGSGKTYRVTREIVSRLTEGKCQPEGLIATTYTKKAANELRERLEQGLYSGDQAALAEGLDQSLIGTVHSVCHRLLERFAFEAGISPRLEILAEKEARALLGQAVEMAADLASIRQLQTMADRLGLWDARKSQYDWKKQVRQIIDAAGSNDFDPARLESMAEASSSALLGFLPQPATTDLDAELSVAIQAALQKIKPGQDDQANTRKYVNLLERTLRDLTAGRLPWGEWVRLGKEQPAVRFKDDAAPVGALITRVESHPRLHEDIREYTRMVFSLARDSMAVFRGLKEERGLLDYSDLERLAYHLLRENPFVRETLERELELLVVDEFQDTSPIQLALFMHLSACARETLWVGDVKQAIYGFRSSDPDLIQAVVASIRTAGATIAEPLGTSWRSSPQLVHLTSELFVPAFSESLGLAAAEVRLQPAPGRVSPPGPALAFFDLSSGQFTKDRKNPRPKKLTNEQYSNALAGGVATLLGTDANCQVVDKETGDLRPVALRDVAILCRTNNSAAAVASALTMRGFPVTLAQKGLLATPEARLALACLRRLADPSDTLAAAEIVALEGAHAPEEWLQQRLDYVARREVSEQQEGGDRWGLEEPFVQPALVALDEARTHLKLFSPTEAFDTALLAANVLGTISAWGPTPVRSAQRRANLEALRALLAGYEQSCATTHIPATIAGFLFWCEELDREGDDEKAVDAQSNAVYVGTYHSAKGLEWPVVVCCDLDSEPKPRLWDVTTTIENPAVPFDLAQPLSNRSLRFWPWPLGGQNKGIPLSDRVDAGDIGREAMRTAEQEELRLLYVGLTRARDLLVLARDLALPAPWLDRLNAPWLADKDGKLQLPDGTDIACRTIALTPPETVESPPPVAVYDWFPAPTTRSLKLPARLTRLDRHPSPKPASAGRSISGHDACGRSTA
jgi:ATP-dependent helicase/nuclease subunit A